MSFLGGMLASWPDGQKCWKAIGYPLGGMTHEPVCGKPAVNDLGLCKEHIEELRELSNG